MSKPRIRCAIYTRKSSEEGLEQDFNSLDAQREACEAYVLSQRHEGWQALPDRFDDGGFSGGNLERPAMAALLEAVRSKSIDIIVVYKIDRLTRSLMDFAKLAEQFDAYKVSFVSVTQQFNTTTSMGRLMLNVLLSFAQFEREVTGERIRDKIAASKKKGLWMGGTPPLGYRPKDRTLVIDEAEADRVRTLFRQYLTCGSVQKLEAYACQENIQTRTGRRFAVGHLAVLLQNPVYIGEIAHYGKRYPGLHPPIIDRDTWEAAQQTLAQHRIDRKQGLHAKHPSLLAGKLFDAQDHGFTPTHAVKRGRRYRYYVERLPMEARQSGKRYRGKRVSAPEIEHLVTESIRKLLMTPGTLLTALGREDLSAGTTQSLCAFAKTLAHQLVDETPERFRLIRSLVQRVRLKETAVDIELHRPALSEWLQLESDLKEDHVHMLSIAARLKLRGVELKFVIDDADGASKPNHDETLIKAIVRGHDWWQRLLNGEAANLREIAKAEGVTDRYVRRMVELAFLAPEIKTAILDGRQPIDLTVQRLIDLYALPNLWTEQRMMI